MWRQDQNKGIGGGGHLVLVSRPCSEGKGRVAGLADTAERAGALPISGRSSQAASCLRSSSGFLEAPEGSPSASFAPFLCTLSTEEGVCWTLISQMVVSPFGVTHRTWAGQVIINCRSTWKARDLEGEALEAVQ